MDVTTIPKKFKKQLENRIVCDVLSDINKTFMTWNRGGALIHRVRAAGFMAEAGIRNIKDGNTQIKENSTFQEMRSLDPKMYDDTINFLYPLVKSGIYSP